MEVKLDHILIRVDNLEETVNEFRDMGFKIYYGTNKKQCHHAMIYFKDQTFIEFIDQSRFPAFLRFLARKKLLNIFGPFFKRIGFYASAKNRFLDYSFHCSDIKGLYQHTKTKATASKLMKLNRVDYFKERLSWELFAYEDTELPFIMSDYSPKKYPDTNSDEHLNGISGIGQIRLTTKSISDYTLKLSNLFGIPIQGNVFRLKGTQIQAEQSDKFEITSIALSQLHTVSQYNLSVLSKYNIGIQQPGEALP